MVTESRPVRRAIETLRKPTAPAALQSHPCPIEMMFAKLKTVVSKLNDRSIAAIWHSIGSLLNEFTSAECRHTRACRICPISSRTRSKGMGEGPNSGL
jgi:hypothetical protein